ncbi:MAG TPA: sugar-binding protein [Tepidisphaeraceae bacterium]|nr:sugar-binding protein [Tepidisphaeraceae bacterium]
MFATRVLTWGLIGLLVAGTSRATAAGPATAPAGGGKFLVGRIDDPGIPESSGIVASRNHAGVFWTLNDSGNPPKLFAIDRAGKLIRAYDVVGAQNRDWEDVAIDGDGNLYIGEVGNNGGALNQVAVYRVPEPDPAAANPPPLKIDRRWQLRFPGKPFDCESLFVWQGHGYVISKIMTGQPATLYRFRLVDDQRRPAVLEAVTPLPIRAPCTGADVSADGKELAVQTVLGPQRLTIDGDPARAGRAVPRGVTFIHANLEAICFAPGGLLATTEGRHVLLFADELFGEPRATAPDRPPEPRHAIPAVEEGVPVVDGDLAEWEPATRLPLRREPASAEPTAQAMAAWAPAGLYVATVVPQPAPGPLRAEWFTGDAVEIFIGRDAPDRGPDYGDGDDRCYAGFGDAGAVELRWPRRPEPPVGARVAGRQNSDDGTYQVEAFIPANVFAGPLEKGDALRLNVSILATKPRRNWYVSESNAAGCWLSPLKWAVVELK